LNASISSLRSKALRTRAALAAAGMLICASAIPDRVLAASPRPSPTASSAAPTEFDDCRGADWCPRMVVIPSGSFLMGSPKNEPGRFDDEGPQRRVTVRSIAVGKFGVTRRQWSRFVAATGRPVVTGCAWSPADHPTWQNPGFAQDDDHPVVCISWRDAQDYVGWLSKRTGHQYRLLSEAEWEYAARAGTTTAYPWGARASHDRANYGAEQCCSPLAAGRDKWIHTSPVGSFPPNAFGLYDMIGNVSQWVQDCHADSYSGLPADGSANESIGCKHRVGRGGLWNDYPEMLRSAARNFAPPDDGTTIETYRSVGFGMRVARAAPQPQAR
jgi:formylglycine-generating enzyme required for sulfatase activity